MIPTSHVQRGVCQREIHHLTCDEEAGLFRRRQGPSSLVSNRRGGSGERVMIRVECWASKLLTAQDISNYFQRY